MLMSSGRQRRYVEPCQCGKCPKLPPNRPPTKREALTYTEHRFAAYWDSERCVIFAIELYVGSYRRWVNDQGWRKPPEWTKGRVALHEVRSGPMFPEEALRWQRQLKKGYRERRMASEAGK